MASVETSHGNSSCILLLLVLVMGSFLTLHAQDGLTRSSFPKDFIFGAGSSAYQFEGAANEDGRGPSIWDTFTHQYPEKIVDQSNGDVALDFYHRYKGDIKLAKDMGLDSFRFSISWSRILPKGTIGGGINKLGIQFYNNLINELHSNGIQPFVTIFNWDLPQALEDNYGGFLSPKIVDDFANYSDLVFKEFGDRVKYWTTLNMPNIMTEYGYSSGAHAPGRCSKHIGNCTAGNSATEPYIVGHNLLLCHAATVQLYRNNYKKSQNGAIGISVEASLVKPIDDTVASNLAALRATDFITGWFIAPVVSGEYPETMRMLLGSRLPRFSEEQASSLRQSFDFIGLNYYSSLYAHKPLSVNEVHPPSYATDRRATLTPFNKDGVPLGEQTGLRWLHSYPKGLTELLEYVKEKYNNPYVIITENGVSQENEEPLEKAVKDDLRIRYHSGHLSHLRDAIKEGANVGGYFIWSWLDDYEWGLGYTFKAGINYVDRHNGLKRHPKDSFYWFKRFLAKHDDPTLVV